MDLASLFGIISGLALIGSAILFDSSVQVFMNLPGLMVVLGGTTAATFLTFPAKDVMNAARAAYFVFAERVHDPNDMVATMIEVSILSRRKGLRELSRIQTENDFLLKAANMLADGANAEEVRTALRIEINSLKARHFVVQDVFRKMGTYAPAFGMLGTLIGLVKMLSQIQNPDAIGPAMAVALLTTFYGSLISSMIFLPMAGKLKSRTLKEIINLEIIFEGAVAVSENNNPILVYEKLSSFIPSKLRRPLKRLGEAQP